MKKLFYLLGLALIINNLFNPYELFGQEVWYNVVTVPPSPNAASLGKYGEVPVDKSTGIPSISIPLLNLSEGGIEVPISLSYHAGGLKVQEEASWVGYGWSLNAGGVITRTMRGRPDDGIRGFLSHANSYPNSSDITSNLFSTDNREATIIELNQVIDNYIDYEPDLFYYNFNGRNGSFMFGNNGNPIGIPFEDIKMKVFKINNIITGFELITPDGLVYTFGSETSNYTNYTDETQVFLHRADPDPYISSWHLKTIYNPNTKSTVGFSYTNFDISSEINYTDNETLERPQGGLNFQSSIGPTRNQSTTTTKAKYLDFISFAGETVQFVSYPENGKVILARIVFGNKGFMFDIGVSQILYGLAEVEFINGLPITNNTYRFVYDLSHPIPSRTSNAIDYWGFFNGENNNSSLIPKITYAGVEYGYAERSPNPLFTKVGILTGIFYPTGGVTKFKYENNQYSRLPQPSELGTPFESESVLASSDYCTNCFDDPVYDYLCKSFYPTSSEYEYVGCKLIYSMHRSAQDFTSHENGFIKIWDRNGILQDTHFATSEGDYELNLAYIPGRIDVGYNGCASITVKLVGKRYLSSDLLVKKDFIAGGLRIKQIKNYDPISNKTTYRTFDYNQSGYLITSLPRFYFVTSELRGSPAYEYQQLLLYSTPVGGLGFSPNSVGYEKVTEFEGTVDNNNGIIETTYPLITEDSSIDPPYLPTLSKQTFRTKPSCEKIFNSENQIIRKTDYTYEPDTYHSYTINGFRATRIKTDLVTANPDYTTLISYANFGLYTYLSRIKKIISQDFFQGNPGIIKEQLYTYNNKHHLNPSIIETTNSEGKLVKTYYYYPNDFIQDIIDCDHYQECYETISTDWNYRSSSDDEPENSKVFYRFASKNVHNQLVEKIVKVNDKEIEHNRFVFRLNGTDENEIPLIDRAENIIENQTPKTEITYDKYDDRRNIQQISIKGTGTPTSYMWGYSGKYLIIKAENISYDDLAILVNNALVGTGKTTLEALVSSITEPSDIRWKDFNKNLRSNLLQSGKLISTYTYKPLIGLTSITDPNGLMTTYEYDLLGRLVVIKDDKGNILKKFEYNFSKALPEYDYFGNEVE